VNTREARDLAQSVAALVNSGHAEQSYALLAPVLARRTPFRLLGLVGEAIGTGPPDAVFAFVDYIAAQGTMGGWVIIGSALGQQLDRDLSAAFSRCRSCIVAADIWYATDILGERVPGPALVTDLGASLTLLAPWREDSNAWVGRAVGVSVHFWAKRSRGAVAQADKAQVLLAFLEPMFEEREMNAVKGVGWGLKTLGKHYSDLTADWLREQLVHQQRPHRALMLRKALTYLTDEQQSHTTGDAS